MGAWFTKIVGVGMIVWMAVMIGGVLPLKVQADPEAMSSKMPSQEPIAVIRPKMIQVFLSIRRALEQQNLLEVKERLDQLLRHQKDDNLYPLERAYLNQLLGQYFVVQARYAEAMSAFEVMLKNTVTGSELQVKALYVLGQLAMMQERYEQALDYFERWLLLPKQAVVTAGRSAATVADQNTYADVTVRLAQLYFRQQRYTEALHKIKLAFKSQADGAEPFPESWLQLKAAIYYEQGAWEACAGVYELMLQWYFKKEHAFYLLNLYGLLQNNEQRLALMRSLDRAQWLASAAHWLDYAYLLLEQRLPYQAALVLVTAIEKNKIAANEQNLFQIASAYFEAGHEDKALDYWRLAAEHSERADQWLALAQWYVHREHFAWAIVSAQQALKRLDVADQGPALLLLGVAHWGQSEYSQALGFFEQVLAVTRNAVKDAQHQGQDQAQAQGTLRNQAHQWLDYARASLKTNRALQAFNTP